MRGAAVASKAAAGVRWRHGQGYRRAQGEQALFQARRHPTRGRAAFLLVAGFTLLVLMAAVFGQQGMLKVRQLEREKADLEARVLLLQEKTDNLRRQVSDMQTDPFLYEKLARERLGLVRPGEVVYDFRENPVAGP